MSSILVSFFCLLLASFVAFYWHFFRLFLVSFLLLSWCRFISYFWYYFDAFLLAFISSLCLLRFFCVSLSIFSSFFFGRYFGAFIYWSNSLFVHFFVPFCHRSVTFQPFSSYFVLLAHFCRIFLVVFFLIFVF